MSVNFGHFVTFVHIKGASLILLLLSFIIIIHCTTGDNGVLVER